MTFIRNIKLKCESILIHNKKYTLSVIITLLFIQQFNTFLINSVKDSNILKFEKYEENTKKALVKGKPF